MKFSWNGSAPTADFHEIFVKLFGSHWADFHEIFVKLFGSHWADFHEILMLIIFFTKISVENSNFIKI